MGCRADGFIPARACKGCMCRTSEDAFNNKPCPLLGITACSAAQHRRALPAPIWFAHGFHHAGKVMQSKTLVLSSPKSCLHQVQAYTRFRPGAFPSSRLALRCGGISFGRRMTTRLQQVLFVADIRATSVRATNAACAKTVKEPKMTGRKICCFRNTRSPLLRQGLGCPVCRGEDQDATKSAIQTEPLTKRR